MAFKENELPWLTEPERQPVLFTPLEIECADGALRET